MINILYRLGFIVDFLSHATIVGFMGGAATVVCLQQLKGILGLLQFTSSTSVVSVMKSVFSQTHQVVHHLYLSLLLFIWSHICIYVCMLINVNELIDLKYWYVLVQWRWESVVLGVGFLFFLFITRFFVSENYISFFFLVLIRKLIWSISRIYFIDSPSCSRVFQHEWASEEKCSLKYKQTQHGNYRCNMWMKVLLSHLLPSDQYYYTSDPSLKLHHTFQVTTLHFLSRLIPIS